MKLNMALQHLGATRVIWIDDHFNDTPVELGKMLAQKLEATRDCDFPEFREIMAQDEYAPDLTEGKLIQALHGVSPERRDEIREKALAVEREIEHAPVEEMSVSAIDTACNMLAISPNDRWSFEGVESKVKAAIVEYDGRDESVSYIVDLNDNRSGGNNNLRGLEILRVLAAEHSKSTAFVLTHETLIDDEAKFEQALVGRLDENGVAPFPFCVISKERLKRGGSGSSDMEEAFRVAIKRAGLRRSVHEVLRLADSVVIESFVAAKRNLLRIPPEVLDEDVVRRGYEEGESELHVIERALTAHIARDVRQLFGTNERVRASNERVRSLRAIKLHPGSGPPNDDLVDFRNAETWESEFLINSAFSPLACGDVFEIDGFEPKAKAGKGRQFVLLGQPCDIQLRHRGDRVARTAVLAPIRFKGDLVRGETAQGDKIKECLLQCTLKGQSVVCDLRNATSISLSILDLATFRADGRVRYDKEQPAPIALLPGQSLIYKNRTSWLDEVIRDFEAVHQNAASRDAGSDPAHNDVAEGIVTGGTSMAGDEDSVTAEEPALGMDEVQAGRAMKKAATAARKAAGQAKAEQERLAKAATEEADRKAGLLRKLQLAFAPPDDFRYVEVGTPEAGLQRRENKKDTGLPVRVTWCLRRIGRIRMPYAADVLDRYVGMLNRSAFDIDFVESNTTSEPTLNEEPIPITGDISSPLAVSATPRADEHVQNSIE